MSQLISISMCLMFSLNFSLKIFFLNAFEGVGIVLNCILGINLLKFTALYNTGISL